MFAHVRTAPSSHPHSLSAQDVGPLGAEVLARNLGYNMALQGIEIHHANLGTKGCLSLCTALRRQRISTIVDIDISYEPFTACRGCDSGRTCQDGQLTHAYVCFNPRFTSWNDIGDEGALALCRCIADLPQLRSVRKMAKYIEKERRARDAATLQGTIKNMDTLQQWLGMEVSSPLSVAARLSMPNTRVGVHDREARRS